MRVIAGKARSLPLKTPDGMGTRPTTDRIKETLFNMLQPYLADAIFVDLFSGSGGIGIEAISRGANHAYFIENDTKAVNCINDNLQFTKFVPQSTIIKQDVISALGSIHEKNVDVIFMDPPYDNEWEKRVLKELTHKPYVTEDTLIVVEASLKTDLPYLEEFGYCLVKEKKYKTNKHFFIRRISE